MMVRPSDRPTVHPMGIDIKAQLSSCFKCSRLQICSRFFVCVSVEKGRCPYSVICMQTTPMLEGDTRVIKTLSIFRTFSLSGRDENVSGVEWSGGQSVLDDANKLRHHLNSTQM